MLDKTAGLLDRRFVLALFLPSLIFLGAVLALVATAVGQHDFLLWWNRLTGAQQALVATGATAFVVFFATCLGSQVSTLIRLWEGYWRGALLAPAASRLSRRQGRRRDRLSYARQYREFPADPSLVLPTRLGNALRAAETYSGDPERYGADAVFLWPRLYLVIPESTRKRVDESRDTMDQQIVLASLSVLFCAADLAVAALLPAALWASALLCGLLLTTLAYRAAVGAALAFGEIVRSCFDLYRRDLMQHLGLEPPATLEAERALWEALQQQLYRRGSTHPDLLRFAPLPPPNSPCE
ncbi:hypothetical protein [Sinosporangium siamense]|uniref:Uncharacterized protein n=1 Tax=Sinosporangium siamense TaxID=1367973 RepID=A0A919RLM9_9ACTN|nr:hypothetical protein [Sinosporangium siamense]GII94694.1 hypothetical protein Ssi02_49250 [Sinosporangium siamense]